MIRRKRGSSLSLRQQGRIAHTEQKRSESQAVHGDALLNCLGRSAFGAEEPGLVIAHFGLNVAVEDHQGERFRCAVRKSATGEPVCGDRVVWMRSINNQGIINRIESRTSVLQRPLSAQRLQIIAANVDRIFIVFVATDPHVGLLDRYLVAAGVAGIEAVIVVNKMDLVENRAVLMASFAHYEQMGYRVIFTSTLEPLGLTELDQALKGRISVFVGESGTGKSSLISQWISSDSLKIGLVNQESGKGRHTTTVTSLYHLPGGGSLIDSPGIREFGLHGVEAHQVARYFPDIFPWAGQCRFSDCQHGAEPDCAVQRELQAGNLHPARLESLRQIQQTLIQERIPGNRTATGLRPF
ncbi:MAG: ribosome small subunit-dependent GTPase A [Magnetococcales bacterium]|nr:ribosome small subunit-dependent GTPase A [Magnetococcales bacterium]